jgi:pimeloyl-ACP methyl ester carboxylesterase
MLPLLEERFDVLAVDLPGFGHLRARVEKDPDEAMEESELFAGELRYIRGIGHTPMSDAPEELAEAIAELALDRPRARPAAAQAATGS